MFQARRETVLATFPDEFAGESAARRVDGPAGGVADDLVDQRGGHVQPRVAGVDGLRLVIGDEFRAAAEVQADACPGEVGQNAATFGDPRRGMQGYRIPHQVHAARTGSVIGQESRGHIGAVDLESLGSAGQRRGTEVVQKAGEEEQVRVEIRGRPQPGGLGQLRAWALRHLDEPLTVDELARQACLSRRTLIRRFHEETGLPPMRWLVEARIDRARELLESGDTPVEAVARLCGLGTAANLRTLFKRHLGVPPSAYRDTFRRVSR